MTKKYFGTDGIRGRVGEYPITPDFMLKLGWAAGMAFRSMGACRILVGKDTRISGYMFESALEAGLSAAGADVMLLGPMPTPAIAYLTRTFHAEAGIVISASHNPHDDNGIKFFSGQGTKLPDEIELMIEELLDAPMTVVESSKLGKVSRINDAPGRYIEFCKSSVPSSTNFAGLKIVVDCAHGATYKVAPSVFKELGADVTVLSAQPNGLNINDNCGSTHMGQLQAAVLAEHADLGIAFDGDGDRVLMVDHTGTVVDGDDLLFIIARDLHERNKLQGGVVGTLMSNLGLELALADLGIPFVRANVGDRYVIAELLERNWQVGGRTPGISFASSTPLPAMRSLPRCRCYWPCAVVTKAWLRRVRRYVNVPKYCLTCVLLAAKILSSTLLSKRPVSVQPSPWRGVGVYCCVSPAQSR